MHVRPATPDEYLAVRSVCDAAMLELDPGSERRASTLVAVEERRVLGALVLKGNEITAVAVRPGRRGLGIGSSLVREAAARRPYLTARFDPHVREFYESLGFEVEECVGDGPSDGGRCVGQLE